MAKQDILDAINATIVENGQKGITAQSLNNILTMMTENAGEGGGSGEGLLRIMVPDIWFLAPACFGPGAIGEGFTPETWTLVQSELESIISSADLSDAEKELYETYLTSMNGIVPAMFAHNAKVYTELKAKAKSKEGVMVLVDQSASYAPAFRLMSKMSIDIDVSTSVPAVCSSLSMPIELGMSDEVMIAFIPIFSDSDIYNRNSQFALNPDGSIIADLVLKGNFIYVPSTTNNEGFLTDEQKAQNSVLYSNYIDSDYVVLVDSSGETYASRGPETILPGYTNVRYFEGLDLKQATLAEDGSVTVTILGTLNAPTA